MRITQSQPLKDKPRLQAVCDLWPLPANETIGLAIYTAFWVGVGFGALVHLMGGGR